jgi:hypothetical protein
MGTEFRYGCEPRRGTPTTKDIPYWYNKEFLEHVGKDRSEDGVVEYPPEGGVDVVRMLEQRFLWVRDTHVPDGGQVTLESITIKDRRVFEFSAIFPRWWNVGVGGSGVTGSQRRRCVDDQPSFVLMK